jgi:hypothetical protein
MLAKLRARLGTLSHSLGIQTALRDRAVTRMKARHAEQKKFERQAHKAHDAADKLLRYDKNQNVPKGERELKKALRLEAKAVKARGKAVVWKSRARKLTQRVEGIETDIAKVKKELAELGPTVNLKKQTVTGGTFEERWIVHNLKEVECCAAGRRRNAYSQSGSPDIHHPYGPGPAADRRDDCSSDTTAAALATGADDPNGLDFSGEGFTGTLAGAHGRWKEVSLEHMIKAGQGYIVYGSGDGHHVERYCPSKSDKSRTVGHGSPPVDFGTIHLFGSGEVERYFIYVGK